MKLLEEVKNKISYLEHCSSAYILAHAAWSACDHRLINGPSILECTGKLDTSNRILINELQQITSYDDYSNADQASMLAWLHENQYSSYIAKKVKMTHKKLVDWI
jgi:hypothetical protein